MARLTREEYDAFVFGEDDAFRLAILGHAALEAEINAALDEAFENGMLPEIKSLHFRARLALIIALGVVPLPHQAAIGALATLRNKFAHGDVSELTPEHVRPLADTFGVIAGDNTQALLIRADPMLVLRMALVAGRVIIDASIDFACQKRAAVADAVAEERRTRELRDALRAGLAQRAPDTEG